MKIKQKLTQCALGLSLLLNPITAEAATSFEVLVSDKPKIDATLYAPMGNFGIYHRSRILDNFSLTTVNYGKNGINVFAGVQALTDKLIPKLGTMYINKFGDLNFTGIVSVGYDKELNLTGTVNARYNHDLSKNLNGVVGAELISSFNADNHLFSTQRLRLGLEHNGNEIGIATDILEVGNDPRVSSNSGIYLKKTF